MIKFHAFKKCVSVLPIGDPVYSERVTDISIVDLGDGPFVKISQDQNTGNGLGKIQIIPEEWPLIKTAVEELFEVCEKLDSRKEKE